LTRFFDGARPSAPAPITDPAGLVVDATVVDGSATVRLAGELDVATAGALRSTLCRLDDQGVHSVVVDLAELGFIDSSGLSELVQALSRSRAAGGDVVLRRPTPATRKVLEIVGLTELFAVEAG
jgi:anti-sigma B factor antagonist